MLKRKRTRRRMVGLTNFFNLEGNQTVIHVDVASCLNHLGHVLVVEPQNRLITFLLVLIIQCDLDSFAFLQLNLSGATLDQNTSVWFSGENYFYIYAANRATETHSLDKPGPDLWSLRVQSDGHWSVFNGSRPKALGSLADVLDGLSMVLYEAGQSLQ